MKLLFKLERKNKIYYKVIFSIFAVWFLFFNIAKVDYYILLEKRNYGYYNFLENNHINSYYFMTSYDDVGDGKNYLVSDCSSNVIKDNGIVATISKNGIITLNGTSERDSHIVIAGDLRLDSGAYSLQDGGASKSLDTYFMYAYKAGEELIYLPDNNIFYVENNDKNNYQVGICVRKGIKLDNLVVTPFISKDSNSYEYEAYPVLNRQGDDLGLIKYAQFKVLKDEKKYIKPYDLYIFYNRYKKCYSKEYRWVTINFGNNIGIQFEGKSVAYGYIDSYGRIYKNIGTLNIDITNTSINTGKNEDFFKDFFYDN